MSRILLTQGSNSIELRRPNFGDQENLDFPSIVAQEDGDNLPVRFREPNWPKVRTIQYVIQILICSEQFALPAAVNSFLVTSNGKLITMEEFDFDDTTVLRTREGILILEDAVELKSYWVYAISFQEKI